MQQYLIEFKRDPEDNESWMTTTNFDNGIIEAHMPMDAAAAYFASDGAIQEPVRVTEYQEPRSWIMEPTTAISAIEVNA